jgi:hypothetical protein
MEQQHCGGGHAGCAYDSQVYLHASLLAAGLCKKPRILSRAAKRLNSPKIHFTGGICIRTGSEIHFIFCPAFQQIW